MTDIKDFDGYITKMQKSVYDKLFFVDKIFDEYITTFLDIGCANGELIKYVHSFFPEWNYIGYDIDSNMIAAAKENVPYAKFYDKWEDINVDPKTTMVNLSSVLHEVCTYSTKEERQIFFDRVFGSGFKYIAIRDMAFTGFNDFITPGLRNTIVNRGMADKLRDFEGVWGLIQDQFSFAHFLLKYKYTENWEREVRENYFSIDVEGLLQSVSDKYTREYSRTYTLPYIQHIIEQDLGIRFDTKTHVQIILKAWE